jgi:hypothetical protein
MIWEVLQQAQYRPNHVKTEFLEYENELYRILWDLKQLTAVRYGDVEDCLRGEEYRRIARLRLPYALQIQQAFASNLTRVGVPVAPPIHRLLTGTVYLRDRQNKPKLLLSTNFGDGFFITTKGQDRVAFTEEFVRRLRSEVQREIDEIGAEIDAAGESTVKMRKRQKYRDELKVFKDDFNAILELCRPLDLPKQGKTKPLSTAPITVSREAEIQVSKTMDKLLLIHIAECDMNKTETDSSE